MMSYENDDSPNPYQSPLTNSENLLTSDTGPRLATKMNRLGAAIIDGIIGIVVALPLMFLTGYFQRAMQNNVSMTELLLTTLFGLVMFIAINGYLLATRGQTVGKMLTKVKIVDYHSNQLLPLGKLIGLRYLPIWIISVIPFVSMLALVDVLFIFGGERRCVHDYIAGTKVLDVTG